MEGHPFLFSRDFQSSGLYIQNKSFSDALINYDIFNNKIILRYKNRYGALDEIYLNSAYVDSFRMNELTFYHLPVQEVRGRFFHIRAKRDSMHFVSSYRKAIKRDSFSGTGEYYFSDVSESIYFYNGTKLFRIRRLSSLKGIISKESYRNLRKKLDKRINFKDINDEQMLSLLIKISTLGEN